MDFSNRPIYLRPRYSVWHTYTYATLVTLTQTSRNSTITRTLTTFHIKPHALPKKLGVCRKITNFDILKNEVKEKRWIILEINIYVVCTKKTYLFFESSGKRLGWFFNFHIQLRTSPFLTLVLIFIDLSASETILQQSANS